MRRSSGENVLTSCSTSVGMSAWWSSTFASLTTRARGSESSFSTNCAPAAYSGMSTRVAAVGFSCGTRSPESQRELVRGYVIAFLPSYRDWAAESVRRAEKPNRRFASRWSEVRS